MKLAGGLIFFICLSSVAFGQQSYNDLALQARVESKPILIIFSGSDWCANCIRFEDAVLSTTEFQDYAFLNLVVYIADFPRNIESQDLNTKKDNETLASKWNNHGVFPRVVLLDNNEKLLKDHQGGFTSTVQFIKWLQ